MNRCYQQLDIDEREKIQEGLWEGKTIRRIAFELNRSPSTISRELQRNLPKEKYRYTPRLAHERAKAKIKRRGQRPRLKNEFIKTYALTKLKVGFSPEQIAGRLALEYPEQAISHEAIYQYIYSQFLRDGYGRCIGEDLRKYLARNHKQRKPKKMPFTQEKSRIMGRISIDERSPLINDRAELGHWEGDSMVSRKSTVGLNTLVERVSGLTMVTKIKNSAKDETNRAVIKRFKKLPRARRKTLTVDNGHENAGHQEISSKLGTKVYFAHPYHSWERGTNENTNGLIRRYLPKGTDFATVSSKEIKTIEDRLNDRPRKRLGYRTPREVFNQHVALKG